MHLGRRIDRDGPDLDGKQEIGFGHDLIVDVGGCLYARESRLEPAERDFQPETIPWHDAAPELGTVDTAQRHSSRHWCVQTIEHEHRRRLRQRLDHQHCRHEWSTREMALEELFADGDVLDPDEPVARLVFGDGVEQRRGVSVVNAPEERWNV
jgi:hypothetical protein